MTITSSATDSSTSFDALFHRLVDNVSRVVHGKRPAIELALTCLLAEGHLLVEDVPGVGKTSLAKALARSIGADFGRVQFTPDLLPSDVVGTSVWNQPAATFEFRPGPIFAQVLLGDEINRASPKTQSALLEAMAERQVTVDGVTHHLARPFLVIATQNPMEHHGTFPLPESQLDRFLMRLSIGYPGPEAETTMLVAPPGSPDADHLDAVSTTAEILAMADAAQGVHVAESLAGYVVDLANRSRASDQLALGISPRATLGLLRAARVWAAATGRGYVIPDDIKALAVPVLAHRVEVAPTARLAGLGADEVIEDLVRFTPVPG